MDLVSRIIALHESLQARQLQHAFGGALAQDLAVFKAFFNRTKDWADLEEMQAAGTLHKQHVVATLVEYLGADDERVKKLVQL